GVAVGLDELSASLGQVVRLIKHEQYVVPFDGTVPDRVVGEELRYWVQGVCGCKGFPDVFADGLQPSLTENANHDGASTGALARQTNRWRGEWGRLSAPC